MSVMQLMCVRCLCGGKKLSQDAFRGGVCMCVCVVCLCMCSSSATDSSCHDDTPCQTYLLTCKSQSSRTRCLLTDSASSLKYGCSKSQSSCARSFPPCADAAVNFWCGRRQKPQRSSLESLTCPQWHVTFSAIPFGR